MLGWMTTAMLGTALAAPTPKVDTQLMVLGDADVRARVSGAVEQGITWQLSAQLYGGRPGEGFVPWPSVGRVDGDFAAFRAGGLFRQPLSRRTSLQVGMAWEPISIAEGVVVGARNEIIPAVAVVAVPILAATHTMETTLSVRHTVGERFALEAGVHPSLAPMWFDGETALTLGVEGHSARQVLENWQPGVGMSWVF